MHAAPLDWLLDLTIVQSFDRSDSVRHVRRFQARDLDVDLSGRVCPVTGVNSGIGRATARAPAEWAAAVGLLCRDRTRGEDAAEAIRVATGNPEVRLEVLDVASLPCVHAVVERFTAGRANVLIHKAGVLPATRQDTLQGLEVTVATNDGIIAYVQTKRMRAVLAGLFARRWSDRGMAVHSMHPGWADTPSVRTGIPRFWRIMRHRLRTPEEGADTVLQLAVARPPVEQSGLFWFNRAPQPTHLLPFTRKRSTDRNQPWNTCMRLAGLDHASTAKRRARD